MSEKIMFSDLLDARPEVVDRVLADVLGDQRDTDDTEEIGAAMDLDRPDRFDVQ